jgi:sec-independent protein translocase protein TatB
VFGVSFGEVMLIGVVALVVVGPRRIPEMMRTLGVWVNRLRNMTTEVRKQTGIDEILRAEGVAGGISELRSMMRGDFTGVGRFGGAASPYVSPPAADAVVDAYGDALEFDRSREYPIEGPDAHGAIPEDLVRGATPVAAGLPAETVPNAPVETVASVPSKDQA